MARKTKRQQRKIRNPNGNNEYGNGNQEMNLKDVWKFNSLEMVTAGLLLSRALRVSSIQITRKGTLSVILYGEFLENIDKFLKMDHGEIEELLNLLQKDSS